jgi:large subunit ribosomal protein L10
MPSAEKIKKVEELSAVMSSAKAIYLADFTGVDVASVTELRNKLRAASVDYQVVKNRLASRAAEAAGISGLGEFLAGPTAIAFAKGDPLAPAKILHDFAQAGGKLQIKTGFLDGRLLSPHEVEVLAKLPSREALLARVAGGIRGPLYGLAGVLNGLLRGLVGAVAAIEKQQREAAPTQV